MRAAALPVPWRTCAGNCRGIAQAQHLCRHPSLHLALCLPRCVPPPLHPFTPIRRQFAARQALPARCPDNGAHSTAAGGDPGVLPAPLCLVRGPAFLGPLLGLRAPSSGGAARLGGARHSALPQSAQSCGAEPSTGASSTALESCRRHITPRLPPFYRPLALLSVCRMKPQGNLSQRLGKYLRL